jgi:hypothetical protein
MHRMLAIPWGTMSQAGQPSEYINELISLLKARSTMIRRELLNERYFRTFCDRLVE